GKFREFQMGFLLAAHSPRDLDEKSIHTLARTKIVKNLPDGFDSSFIGRSLGFNRDQIDEVRKLHEDEAIVSISSRHPDPILIEVPDSPLDKTINWKNVQKIMAPKLAQKFSLVKPAPLPKKKPEDDTADLKRLVLDVLNRPFLSKTVRLNNVSGFAYKKAEETASKCVHLGYLKEHSISFGKRGGQFIAYEVTDKGFLFVTQPKWSLPGKGEFPHKFAQHEVAKKVKDWNLRPEIELCFRGKNVDVGVDTGSDFVAIEIQMCSETTSSNVKADLDRGFTLVIVLACSAKSRSALDKKVYSDLGSSYHAKTRFMTISQFLESSSFPC
ncbi:MAG: hypothetical protein KC964_16485, partial [Candidatus Omnitrophica bacterium]|nr:hypothetical protein [Candidatus Omnitrophota bacterium]